MKEPGGRRRFNVECVDLTAAFKLEDFLLPFSSFLVEKISLASKKGLKSERRTTLVRKRAVHIRTFTNCIIQEITTMPPKRSSLWVLLLFYITHAGGLLLSTIQRVLPGIVSFDLDDTIWPIRPVVEQANEAVARRWPSLLHAEQVKKTRRHAG